MIPIKQSISANFENTITFKYQKIPFPHFETAFVIPGVFFNIFNIILGIARYKNNEANDQVSHFKSY